MRRTALRDVDADTWIGPASPGAAGQRDSPKIELGHLGGKTHHLLSYADAGASSIQVPTGDIENYRTFKSAPGWKAGGLSTRPGAVVLASIGGGKMYALSDPDLINNHGLADQTNRAAAGLFVISAVAPQGPVFFDVTLNGFERTRSILKLMLEPPFLGATLCALAAALMMMWHAVSRYGAPRRAVRELAMGKQVLADNQAGLDPHGRPRALAWVVAMPPWSEASRRLRLARRKPSSVTPSDAFFDRLGLGGRTTDTTDQYEASAAEQARNNSELMDAAARLHRWRLEMTRESS